jgi:hypothetical protein
MASASAGMERPLKGNIRIYIAGRTGRDIGEYSDKPAQREVLFRHGLKFRIVRSISKGADGKLHAQVEELPE